MPPHTPIGKRTDQTIAIMILAVMVCALMMMVVSWRSGADVEVTGYDREELENWRREEAKQKAGEEKWTHSDAEKLLQSKLRAANKRLAKVRKLAAKRLKSVKKANELKEGFKRSAERSKREVEKLKTMLTRKTKQLELCDRLRSNDDNALAEERKKTVAADKRASAEQSQLEAAMAKEKTSKAELRKLQQESTSSPAKQVKPKVQPETKSVTKPAAAVAAAQAEATKPINATAQKKRVAVPTGESLNTLTDVV